MSHLVLFGAMGMFAGSWWLAVTSVPWTASLRIPTRPVVALGLFLVLAAALDASTALTETENAGLLLRAIGEGWWGSFFLLLPFTGLPSTARQEFLGRVGGMLAVLSICLTLSLYLEADWERAILRLWLVLLGGALVVRPPRPQHSLLRRLRPVRPAH